MQAPFNDDVLSRAGVSSSLIPRTLQALRVLDLIGEDGTPTETLELLRRSPESELQGNLAAWIRVAYADVLAFADPADSETTIRDAFRVYNPVGQQDRMVSLFMGLCSAAGMRADPVKESRPRQQTRKPPASAPKPSAKRTTSRKQSSAIDQATGIPAPLLGLLSNLPSEGETWTKADREKFVTAFGAVLDFCYTIKDDEGGSG